MSYETTLIYTEPLVRQAVLASWRRSIGIGYVIALVVSAFILGLLIAQGNSSWLIGSLATALAFGVLIAALLYVFHYRNSLREFREMGSPHATFLIEEASFTIGSSIGTATLQWLVQHPFCKFVTCWFQPNDPKRQAP